MSLQLCGYPSPRVRIVAPEFLFEFFEAALNGFNTSDSQLKRAHHQVVFTYLFTLTNYMTADLNARVKALTPTILKKYTPRSNLKAAFQFANTLIPYTLLMLGAIYFFERSWWLSLVCTLGLAFFIVRIFMLMHDCGHRCMFKAEWLNTVGGFISGVIVGMPEYVWSQHHAFHHQTNGNWEKYRGPLNILTIDQYSQLSPAKQRSYEWGRSIYLAPIGAFMYFIFNPRVNWLIGSVRLAAYCLAQKIKQPKLSWVELANNYPSRVWQSMKEYRHMSLNNIVLISAWIVLASYVGALPFFTVYLVSLSLAGAAGIIIFTIQHNFEDSYAADTAHWDYYSGALQGTSFLVLPKVINWFGLDIAYHHIHHLSARIPNYNLARCHKEYAEYFVTVPRLKLGNVKHSFDCILWDTAAQKIITIAHAKNQMS